MRKKGEEQYQRPHLEEQNQKDQQSRNIGQNHKPKAPEISTKAGPARTPKINRSHPRFKPALKMKIKAQKEPNQKILGLGIQIRSKENKGFREPLEAAPADLGQTSSELESAI